MFIQRRAIALSSLGQVKSNERSKVGFYFSLIDFATSLDRPCTTHLRMQRDFEREMLNTVALGGTCLPTCEREQDLDFVLDRER
jgi:hypothetical protein